MPVAICIIGNYFYYIDETTDIPFIKKVKSCACNIRFKNNK